MLMRLFVLLTVAIDSAVATLTRPLILLAIAVAWFLVFGGRFFPESEFELAPDSRLPRWFTLADGLSREDVMVTLEYYTGLCSLRWSEMGSMCATLELRDIRADMHGKVQGIVTEANGYQFFGLLDLHGQQPPMEGVYGKTMKQVRGIILDQKNVGGNPSYVTIRADGITQVIEHKYQGDVFYMTDNPAVKVTRGDSGLVPAPAPLAPSLNRCKPPQLKAFRPKSR